MPLDHCDCAGSQRCLCGACWHVEVLHTPSLGMMLKLRIKTTSNPAGNATRVEVAAGDTVQQLQRSVRTALGHDVDLRLSINKKVCCLPRKVVQLNSVGRHADA
jgi:hypothetical protein